MEKMKIVTMRIDPDVLEMADSLVGHIQPGMRAGRQVTQSTVLRLALLLGLASLEQERANDPR